MDLSRWKLQKWYGPEIEPEDLPGFSEEVSFTKALVFRCPVEGATTSGSKYPRSELREMTPDGKKAAWSADKGIHILSYEFLAIRLPLNKPHMVVGQIHDGKNDVLQIRVEGSSAYIAYGKEKVLFNVNALQEWIPIDIEVRGGKVRVYCGGDLKATFKPRSRKGLYFKVGCYLQSNLEHDEEGEYGEVVVTNIVAVHS